MRARFIVLWATAVLAAALAFIVHLALRFETVRLGYEVGAQRTTERQLVEARRLLAIEAGTLKQASRVEAVARGSLQMDVAEPGDVVVVGGSVNRPTAGRLR